MDIWLLWIEFPHVQHGILATRDEPTVVLKPAYSLHRLGMGGKFECRRDLGSIELVHPDVFVVLAGKEMTTVGEDNLTALLDWDALVCLQSLVQDVEELHLVAQANHQVKAGRMEGNGVCLCLGVMD